MSQFQVHDLVRVKEQPNNQFVRLVGLNAVITGIEGEYAEIHELQLTGELYGGQGTVPLSCLESPKASDPWRAAHAVYKQRTIKEEIEFEYYGADPQLPKPTKAQTLVIELVADRHKLDAEVLKAALNELQECSVILFRKDR